jgi:DNA-binding CsgD family transcriptional regulator
MVKGVIKNFHTTIEVLYMQMLLPIFPQEVKLLSPVLGVFEKDTIVTYLHAGAPVFSHAKDDIRSFRYITSKLVLQGLCRLIDISDCFGVSYDSVKRYLRKLRELGDSRFFRDNRRGSHYKLVGSVVTRMQRYLDDGKSNSEIARLEDVSEGAVRHALKTGLLKKTAFR